MPDMPESILWYNVRMCWQEPIRERVREVLPDEERDDAFVALVKRIEVGELEYVRDQVRSDSSLRDFSACVRRDRVQERQEPKVRAPLEYVSDVSYSDEGES